MVLDWWRGREWVGRDGMGWIGLVDGGEEGNGIGRIRENRRYVE